MRSSPAARLRCFLSIVASAGVTLLASSASGQMEAAPCKPLGCQSVDVGPFVPPLGWTFVPDRRPVAVITMANGNYTQNELGLVGWWYCEGTSQDDGDPYGVFRNGIPDAFDELLERMNDLYDLGFRRIQLRLPAGNINEAANYADSSQWWAMPSWRRTRFQSVVGPWIASKAALGDPVDVGVYGGYKLNDPCTSGMDGSHPPNFTNSSDACLAYQNIKPWIDIGVTEYWFDNSSPFWRDMYTLQHSNDYSDAAGNPFIKIGGEAVPTITGSCATGPDKLKVPDPTALIAGAWTASYRFARSRFTYDDAYVTFNPDTTEVGLMLNSQPTPSATDMCGPFPHNSPKAKSWDFAEARTFYEHGWVLWSFLEGGQTDDYDVPRGCSIEAIMRIYDFGPITALADFDGDGFIQVAVNDNDYLAFTGAWVANLFTSDPRPTFAMGDVNGDDWVDFEDLFTFIAAGDNWDILGLLDGIDLGDPLWVP